MAFADVSGPQIESARITRGNDSGQDSGITDSNFQAGEYAYIHLNFNEAIRFADNSANHSDLKLLLELSDTASGQTVSGLDAWAEIVALQGNSLIFRYLVPEQLTNSNNQLIDLSHEIVGIRGIFAPDPNNSYTYTRNILNSSANPWNLVLTGKNNVNISGTAYNNFLATITDADRANILTSKSLITDLAGNPAAQTLPSISPVRLDNIDPVLTSVLSTSTGTAGIFAGPGSTITLTAAFSEPLDLTSAAGITAQLNISANGQPVEIAASKIITNSNGVNAMPATRIEFEPCLITGDMSPLIYSDDQNLPISINTISFSSPAADICGNTWQPRALIDQTTTAKVLPNNQFWLDTNRPLVTSQLASETAPENYNFSGGLEPNDPAAQITTGKIFLPVAHIGSNDSFYVSWKINDSILPTADYASGTMPSGSTSNLLGSFSWYDPDQPDAEFAFKYAVSYSSTLPTDDKFQQAVTGTDSSFSYEQVTTAGSSDDIFLHIKLLDEEVYDLTSPIIRINAADNVGNIAGGLMPLIYSADEAAPFAEQIGFSTAYDAANSEGSYTAKIRLTDPSKVNTSNIAYQWADRGAQPTSGSWLTYNGAGDSAETIELTLIHDNLAGGSLHRHDLYIRCQDEADNSNQAVLGPWEYDRDLRFPGYTATWSQEMTAEPEFKLTNITPTNSSPNGATMLVLIRDPLGNGDQYWVRAIDSTMTIWDGTSDFNLNNYKENLLDELTYDYSYANNNTAQYWTYAEVKQNEDYTLYDGSVVANVRFGFRHTELLMSNDSPEAKRLKAIMAGFYYGDIEMMLITGSGIMGSDHDVQVTDSQGTYLLNILNYQNDGNFIQEGAYSSSRTYQYYFDEACTQPVSANHPWYTSNVNKRKISYIPGSALINVEEISMRAAPDRFVLSENGTTTPSTTSYFSTQYPSIHQATITGLTDTDLNENVQTPADGAKYLISDLAGSRFQIDLANLRASDFGISDIDFDSPNTNVSLYLLTSPDEGADVAYSDTIFFNEFKPGDRTGGLVWQAPLSPLASQIITLPAGVTPHSGQYVLTVSIQAKTSAKVEDFFFTDIFVSKQEINSFSLNNSRFDLRFYDSNTDTIYDEFSIPYDANTYEIDLTTDQEITFAEGNGNKITWLNFEIAGGTGTYTFYDKQMDAMRYLPINDEFIKIWNATDPQTAAEYQAAAAWRRISQANADNTARTIESQILWPADSANMLSLIQQSPTAIPLFSGRDNIICYQVANAAGKMSEIKTLIIHEDTSPPELSLNLDPDSSRYTTSVNLTAQDLSGQTDKFMFVDPGLNAATISEMPSDGVQLSVNGNYFVYAYDDSGNIAVKRAAVNHIDSNRPELIIDNDATIIEGNHFTIKARMFDTTDWENNYFLLSFDPDYAELIGDDTIKLPEADGGGQWFAESGSFAGIYYTSVEYEDNSDSGNKIITVKGVFQADPADTEPVSRSITLTACDQAGNTSSSGSEYTFTSMVSAEPVEATLYYINGLPALRFPTPVALRSIQGATAGEQAGAEASPYFSRSWENLPIYANGSLELIYEDLFGNVYEETIDILGFLNNGLSVELSPESPTNGSVTVTLSTLDSGATLTLPVPAALPQAESINRGC
jgi:hypothetical protein